MHAKLFNQNALEIFAAERTDEVAFRRSCRDPLMKGGCLFGSEGNSRGSPTLILQTLQAFLIESRDPLLADTPGKTDRHGDSRSGPPFGRQDYNPQSFRLKSVFFQSL